MTTATIQRVEQQWFTVKDVIFYPHTEAEYEQLVTLLDSLIDEVGENEAHELASLMEVLSILIEKYEDEHVPEITEI